MLIPQSTNHQITCGASDGTADLATLTLLSDANGPTGLCPSLPLDWDRSVPGAGLSAGICHDLIRAQVPIAVDCSASTRLVIAGRRSILLARMSRMQTVPIRLCSLDPETALYRALLDLVTDPAMHSPAVRVARLGQYITWLYQRRSVVVGGQSVSTQPLIRRLFGGDRRVRIKSSIAELAGYSTRSSRVTQSRDATDIKRTSNVKGRHSIPGTINLQRCQSDVTLTRRVRKHSQRQLLLRLGG